MSENDPFLAHAFLSALEASGSVGARAGCVPRLVLVRDGAAKGDGASGRGSSGGDGRLVGAVPLYLKTNSYGEFIFDWSWANAAHRAGVRYYPKLVAAIPFTPATGQRLPVLAASGVDSGAVVAELLRGVRLVADDERASSIHFLFCTEAEKHRLAEDGATGYFPRLSMQFHWRNRHAQQPDAAPFADFDDYLGSFRSRNRKQVRKERREAAAHGLAFRVATGADLEARDWKALRAFYVANVERHHGVAYLSDRFFQIARETLADRMVSTIAYAGTRPVAGTINFERGAHLYGRYWGCLAEYEMLHFELCYYQLIERAIARRCTLFEAGAQGEHKLKRGLTPALTHSAHWIRHPELGAAVAEYVRSEEEAVVEQARYYEEHSPFRAEGEPGD